AANAVGPGHGSALLRCARGHRSAEGRQCDPAFTGELRTGTAAGAIPLAEPSDGRSVPSSGSRPLRDRYTLMRTQMRKRSLRRTLTGLVAGGLLMPVAACGGAASRAGGGAVPTNVGAACRHGSGSAVSGHAFDQQDAPMEGVEIWIRIVPLNSGL